MLPLGVQALTGAVRVQRVEHGTAVRIQAPQGEETRAAPTVRPRAVPTPGTHHIPVELTLPQTLHAPSATLHS